MKGETSCVVVFGFFWLALCGDCHGGGIAFWNDWIVDRGFIDAIIDNS